MATYNQIIEGCKIFASHLGEDDLIGGAEHDVIFGAPSDIELSDEEVKSLENLGWHLSEEYDCWIHFA